MAMIGPAWQEGQLEGHESFDFVLSTPEWFSSHLCDEIVPGRHHLFVRDLSYAALEQYVRDYCDGCGEATTWGALAQKLGRLGKWEFEDYLPYVEPPTMW